jgi:hypothetical protein
MSTSTLAGIDDRFGRLGVERHWRWLWMQRFWRWSLGLGASTMGGTVLQALFENEPRTDSAIQLVTDFVR